MHATMHATHPRGLVIHDVPGCPDPMGILVTYVGPADAHEAAALDHIILPAILRALQDDPAHAAHATPTPYTVTRTGPDAWTVDGCPGLCLDAAVSMCALADEEHGGDPWDMPTYSDCRDGLEALEIDETLTVTPYNPEE